MLPSGSDAVAPKLVTCPATAAGRRGAHDRRLIADGHELGDRGRRPTPVGDRQGDRVVARSREEMRDAQPGGRGAVAERPGVAGDRTAGSGVARGAGVKAHRRAAAAPLLAMTKAACGGANTVTR